MTKIIIKGMTCERCSSKVENILLSVKGISSIKSFLNDGYVTYNGKADEKEITLKIEAEGYSVVSFEKDVHTLNKPSQKKSFFARLIEKIESSNKKGFGDGKLDCCNIQKKK